MTIMRCALIACVVPIMAMEEGSLSYASLAKRPQIPRVVARVANRAVYLCDQKSGKASYALYVAPLGDTQGCPHCAHTTDHCTVEARWESSIDLNDSGTRLLVPKNETLEIYTVADVKNVSLFCSVARDKAIEAFFLNETTLTCLEKASVYSYIFGDKGSDVQCIQEKSDPRIVLFTARRYGGLLEKYSQGVLCSHKNNHGEFLARICIEDGKHILTSEGNITNGPILCAPVSHSVIRGRFNADTMSLSPFGNPKDQVRRGYFLMPGEKLHALCVKERSDGTLWWAFGYSYKGRSTIKLCVLEKNGDLMCKYQERLAITKILWPDSLNAPYVVSEEGTVHALPDTWLTRGAQSENQNKKRKKDVDDGEAFDS